MKYSEFEQLIKNSGMSDYEQAIFVEKRVMPFYLQNEPRFKSKVAEIWNFQDSPYCWGPDCGIDSIVKNYDNTVSAVQSKFYDKEYFVKKSDIDSCFSESGRAIIDSIILFLTTDKIGSNARRMIENYEKPVTIISRKDLEKFDWPESLEKFYPPKSEPRQERPHQTEAINDSVKTLKEYKKAQVYSPCGTGKTFEAVRIVEEVEKFYPKRKDNFIAVFFEPSRALVSQTSEKVAQDFMRPIRMIGVCSDQDVFHYDEARLLSFELNTPIVTSDANKLSEILMQPFDGITLVIATYHSHHIIKKTQSLIKRDFNIKILDEAHHLAGFGEGKIFRPVLNKIQSEYTLSMTATPRKVTSGVKTLAKKNDQQVISMDDEIIFGPVAHKLSHKKAVDEGIILPTEMIGLFINDRKIAKLLKTNKIITIKKDKDLDIRALSIAEAIIRFMRESNKRKFYIFLRTIKASQKFAQLLNIVNDLLPEEEKLPNFLVQHISGEMPNYKTTFIKNSFKEHKDYAVLTNAKYLEEGVDDPGVDGVVFVEPRYSLEQIEQIVGRACRIDPDNPYKTSAYALIPYCVLMEEDLEAALIKSPFDNIRQVIESLSLNDDIVSSEIDEMSLNYGYTGKISSGKFKSIKWVLPENFTNREKEIFKATELIMLNKLLENWMVWYGKLKYHLDNNNNVYPSSTSSDPGERQLAEWVQSQRAAFNRQKGRMTSERKKLLELLPNWSWNPFDDSWNNIYNNVLSFYNEFGFYPVEDNNDNVEEKRMGTWLRDQRRAYRKNKMSQSRIDLMEKLPDWVWNKDLEAEWNEMFKFVKNFKKENGYLPSSSSAVPYEAKAGRWISTQRKLYKIGKLDLNRQKLLMTIPDWTWTGLSGKPGQRPIRAVV